MSNAIFPLLPGINIEQTLRPNWRTKVQKSVSGVRQTIAYMGSPLWDITLDYNVLRQGFGETELDQLIGFFNGRHGRFDHFLLDHPDYNSVTNKLFGQGDGTRTQWQLLREIGGFNEAVKDPKDGYQIFKTDWQGKILQSNSPRTNLLVHSQNFANAIWLKGGVTVVSNAYAVPDGTTTAAFIQESAATSAHYLQVLHTTTTSDPRRCSIWVRASTRSRIWVATAGTGYTVFDAATGTVVQLGASMSDATVQAFPGGWCRCSVSISSNTTWLGVGIWNGGASYVGDGASGLYIWGAQLEPISSAATAYIPTTTAAVTVTDVSVADGLVTFGAAPAAGAVLEWTGGYYWRVAFRQDALDCKKFLQGLWEAGKIELESVK